MPFYHVRICKKSNVDKIYTSHKIREGKYINSQLLSNNISFGINTIIDNKSNLSKSYNLTK